MKLCVISPGVVHAVPRTMALAGSGTDVDFIDVTGSADVASLQDSGVRCHLNAGKGYDTHSLRRLLSTLKPDLIVCHYASGDHFFAAIAHGQSPVAAIAMGNDILYDDGDSRVPWMRKMLVRMALRRCCHISAKSRILVERIRSYGVKVPVDVNYWGADLNLCTPGSAGAARRALGLPEGVPVILSPRALEPRLHIVEIVQAFGKVRQRFADARLVIVGYFSPGYRKQVEQAVADGRLTGCVDISGKVSQELLVDYYRAADVVVSMGDCEGFPNTILEVMACRVPFVIGRIPQIEELLTDNLNASICDIEPGSIAGRIIELLEDPGKCRQQAEAALQTVTESADLARNGVKFLEQAGDNCSSARPRGLALFRAGFLLSRIVRKVRFLRRSKHV